jgi:formate dehydrogenase maturation protein FdhE
MNGEAKNPQDLNSCNSIKFVNKNSCDSCNSWIKKNPQDLNSWKFAEIRRTPLFGD